MFVVIQLHGKWTPASGAGPSLMITGVTSYHTHGKLLCSSREPSRSIALFTLVGTELPIWYYLQAAMGKSVAGELEDAAVRVSKENGNKGLKCIARKCGTAA